jgi:non-specific serine/threonine protein kinase
MGEVIWRVPPLQAPPVDPLLRTEDVVWSEAVRLFVQRAALARPEFRLAQDNTMAVARICQQLEGIPLAIELAAARVSALSVYQISARLASSLGLLSSTSRSAPTRQRTLRATIDWSYALLTESERLLFDRLAVFAGGWSLEAAESICAGDGLPSEAVLDLLARLVDKSLVVAEVRSGSASYVLLDTLRAYAWESLEASGTATEIQRRHRDWYLRRAESFDAEWHGPRQRAWLDEWERDEGNLRNALRGCVDRSEPAEGLRLAASLFMFWDVSGRLAEGLGWLSQLLDMADASLPPLVRAKALYAIAHLASGHLDADAGAETMLEESLALCRGLDARLEVTTTFRLAGVARLREDDARASALCSQMLALAQRMGDRVGTYLALSQLTMIAIQQGELARARALGEQSLRLKRQQSDAQSIGVSLRTLAELAWLGGDAKRAADRLRESLTMHNYVRNRRGIADALELLAEICGARQYSERAVRLYGATEGLRQATGARRTGVPRMDPARRETTLASARASLSAAEFKQAWSDGRQMSPEETMRCALESLDELGSAQGQADSTTQTG